ncbi:general stress protein [Actinokineospora soli]|uniref:General stress protein n=1 Tax=Actinokineospora soli TaxID=1048753 RepID=A0ABW2TSR0_9PSEU
MTRSQSEKAQQVVGSYATYAEAERAVDHLSDQRFPVEHAAIVGRGLTTVEQVTGRLTTAKAALTSAATGALLGGVLGWLFGLFNLVNPLVSGLLLALYGALLGAIIGGVLGLLAHTMTGGSRDFSSVSSMRADSYDVLVDAEFAEQARGLLAQR